jgi:hypothetical protein
MRVSVAAIPKIEVLDPLVQKITGRGFFSEST